MSAKNLGFRWPKSNRTSNRKRRGADHEIDEVAARHGFLSREPVQRLSRRKGIEPSTNLTILPRRREPLDRLMDLTRKR